MKLKKVIALAMAAMMSLSIASCGSKKTENDKMVIGYTIYEPMNFMDENGKLTGFDTEFAEAVYKKLGMTPEFVEINWGDVEVVWKRPEVVEMTLEEVCKALGKNVKIVKSKK